MVRALCPTIFGNELVKAGLLLALAGGVRKHANSATAVPLRGDIHVLLVGDPGLGKSQLLQERRRGGLASMPCRLLSVLVLLRYVRLR